MIISLLCVWVQLFTLWQNTEDLIITGTKKNNFGCLKVLGQKSNNLEAERLAKCKMIIAHFSHIMLLYIKKVTIFNLQHATLASLESRLHQKSHFHHNHRPPRARPVQPVPRHGRSVAPPHPSGQRVRDGRVQEVLAQPHHAGAARRLQRGWNRFVRHV